MSNPYSVRMTRAESTLKYIQDHPGATFTQVHEATMKPDERSFAQTSRALDRLVRDGLIRRERDGRAVRSWAVNP